MFLFLFFCLCFLEFLISFVFWFLGFFVVQKKERWALKAEKLIECYTLIMALPKLSGNMIYALPKLSDIQSDGTLIKT